MQAVAFEPATLLINRSLGTGRGIASKWLAVRALPTDTVRRQRPRPSRARHPASFVYRDPPCPCPAAGWMTGAARPRGLRHLWFQQGPGDGRGGCCDASPAVASCLHSFPEQSNLYDKNIDKLSY